MTRRRILMHIGILPLLALALQGCDFFCLFRTLFGGDPRLCYIGGFRPSLTCAEPDEPGTAYFVPIGTDVEITNPCEYAPGIPSLGRFSPGDSFTFDSTPDELSLIQTDDGGGGPPSFKLHATGPVDQLVPYTYSTASGDFGKGYLLVTKPTGIDLAVTMTASPSPATVGDQLTYTITVTNNGTATANLVSLTDTLPAGVTFAGTGGGCALFSSDTVRCDPNAVGNVPLPAGESFTFLIFVTPTAAGTITNTATATSNPANDIDPANNTATATTTVVPPAAPAADLAVTITDSPDPVGLNRLFTYTVTVTNNGPSSATGVVLTDTLPSVVEDGPVTASQGSCTRSRSGDNAVQTCNLGTLASGASATLTIPSFPFRLGTMTSTATVTANERDGNPANNTAVATTTVN